MAAVLACGPEAVLSHWSGGGLWRVYPDRGSSGPVDVTVPFGTHRARPGVRLHRVRVLPPEEVTHLDGIPVTTLARTILDLASVLSSGELRRVLAVALSEHSMEREQLTELVVRYPGRRGVPMLRALLKDDTPPALTVSKAEQRFLRLITRARLPAPEVNAWFEGYKVDFLWRTHRLIVEVDGFAFHGSRERFENDRRRDGELTARGFRVMRVTWRQITQEPEVVLVQVAQALAIA
jgi:very-short-patch-repair endonuclease